MSTCSRSFLRIVLAGALAAGALLKLATFGVAGTVTPLVDQWADQGRLPAYMRTAPKVWA